MSLGTRAFGTCFHVLRAPTGPQARDPTSWRRNWARKNTCAEEGVSNMSLGTRAFGTCFHVLRAPSGRQARDPTWGWRNSYT